MPPFLSYFYLCTHILFIFYSTFGLTSTLSFLNVFLLYSFYLCASEYFKTMLYNAFCLNIAISYLFILIKLCLIIQSLYFSVDLCYSTISLSFCLDIHVDLLVQMRIWRSSSNSIFLSFWGCFHILLHFRSFFSHLFG